MTKIYFRDYKIIFNFKNLKLSFCIEVTKIWPDGLSSFFGSNAAKYVLKSVIFNKKKWNFCIWNPQFNLSPLESIFCHLWSKDKLCQCFGRTSVCPHLNCFLKTYFVTILNGSFGFSVFLRLMSEHVQWKNAGLVNTLNLLKTAKIV